MKFSADVLETHPAARGCLRTSLLIPVIAVPSIAFLVYMAPPDARAASLRSISAAFVLIVNHVASGTASTVPPTPAPVPPAATVSPLPTSSPAREITPTTIEDDVTTPVIPAARITHLDYQCAKANCYINVTFVGQSPPSGKAYGIFVEPEQQDVVYPSGRFFPQPSRYPRAYVYRGHVSTGSGHSYYVEVALISTASAKAIQSWVDARDVSQKWEAGYVPPDETQILALSEVLLQCVAVLPTPTPVVGDQSPDDQVSPETVTFPILCPETPKSTESPRSTNTNAPKQPASTINARKETPTRSAQTTKP